MDKSQIFNDIPHVRYEQHLICEYPLLVLMLSRYLPSRFPLWPPDLILFADPPTSFGFALQGPSVAKLGSGCQKIIDLTVQPASLQHGFELDFKWYLHQFHFLQHLATEIRWCQTMQLQQWWCTNGYIGISTFIGFWDRAHRWTASAIPCRLWYPSTRGISNPLKLQTETDGTDMNLI